MSNLSNTIRLVSNYGAIDVCDDEIQKVGFKKIVSRCLDHRAKQERDARVIKYAKDILEGISKSTPVQERVLAFKLSEATIKRYKEKGDSRNLIARLDYLIVKKRTELWPDQRVEPKEFQLASNQKLLTRWLKYGFSEDLFIKHFECAEFLINSQIASAMATWGSELSIIDEKPHLLVNGRLEGWEKVRDSNEIKYHADSRTFRLYDSKSANPMEYLGGGQGLVPCDRYNSEMLPVVTTIRTEEVKYLQDLAKQYLRPSEVDGAALPEMQGKRNYVLQVVTSEQKAGQSSFAQTFKKAQHPFLRLISPDGRVKIVGFMKYNNNFNLLNHGRGCLDSPDFGDLCYSGSHYITNIAIDEEEAEKFKTVCQDLLQDKDLVFNYRTQNCTSFVKYILKDLKLADFPEAPTATQVFCKLLTGVKEVEVLDADAIESKKSAHPFVETVRKVLNIALTVILKPFVLLLGDRPFSKFGEKVNAADNRITQFFKWLIEPVTIDYPMQIQNWQKGAASTEELVKDKKIIFSSKSDGIEKQKGHHLTNNTRVPGFGTPVIGSKKQLLSKKIWKVVKKVFIAITAIFSASLVTYALATSHLWVPIVAVAALALPAFGAIANKINSIIHPCKGMITLHPEMVRHNEQEGPGLGTSVETDVRVINDAEQSYLFKLELLESAKQSIDISFNFAGGEHFDEVLDIIERKMRFSSHFRTHLIISSDFLDEKQIERMQSLKKKYENNFNYLITDRLFLMDHFIRTEENHTKAMVVDGQYFVVGGSGIHDKMDREVQPEENKGQVSFVESLIDQTFKDTDIIGYGELAHTIRGQIYNLYQVWAQRMGHELEEDEGVYTRLDPDLSGRCKVFHDEHELIQSAQMSFLVGGPEHRAANPITQALVHEIDRAENDVQLSNLYFNPDQTVKDAIKRAKKRKVKTVGHFNGVGEGISGIHYNYILNNHKNYRLLTDAYEYQVPDQLYHKKVTTIDGKVAVVGSFNLGQKSAHCDNEAVVLINDDRVIAALNQGIKDDEEKSRKVKCSITKSKDYILPTKVFSAIFSRLGNIMG